MRIGLNLLHANPDIGGGWNYIVRLVRTLGDHNREDEFVAYVTRESAPIVPRQGNFRCVLTRVNPRRRAERVAFENTWLHALALRDRVDCMHWFSSTQALLNVVPGLVTVYDLQAFRHVHRYGLVKRAYLRIMVGQTARRAATLLPMSDTTASELVSVLHADAARMVVIPPVVSQQFAPQPREVTCALREKYGLPDAFWLYVAHYYPHKNHVRLLEGYRVLKAAGRTPWPLVLRGDDAGGKAAVLQAMDRLSLGRDVILLPRLEESELPALYSAATALVYPSLYEGGGMPVMEAMACGCPVVASDIPTGREFAGDAALLFDPTDIEDIGRAMAEYQQDELLRERQRQLGLQRVDRCRPEAVYSALMHAYRRTCALRSI